MTRGPGTSLLMAFLSGTGAASFETRCYLKYMLVGRSVYELVVTRCLSGSLTSE